MIRTASTAALAGLLLAAVPAQAVTTIATITPGAGDTITVTDLSPTVTDYTFDFTINPSSLYVDFMTSGSFDLLLIRYEDNVDGGNDVTGYLLDDGATRWTTDTAFCGDAAGFVGAGCNLIADYNANGANAAATKDTNPETPVLLLEDLAAGSYRLGIFDSATPTQGQAVLRVSEVPAPMAGLMLVSALGLWRVGSRKSA
ncbi:MAG: hypothetical protein AAF676_13725 [Pseudomonadota bacterium]